MTKFQASGGKPCISHIYNPTMLDYSAIVGNEWHGYLDVLNVEEVLVSYISPSTAGNLGGLALPSKPLCKATVALVCKAYAVVVLLVGHCIQFQCCRPTKQT